MHRLVPLALIAACAGPSVELAAPTRVEPRPPAPFDGRAFAAEQQTPAECERAARRKHETNADEGWTALRACVERTAWPRGGFTGLQSLTGGFWDAELQKRPDAPRLLQRVIAARGGDIEGDVPAVQKSRAPLFTLAAAMKQPEVYKGRYVLVRGALDSVHPGAGSATALVVETSLRATAREVDVGPRHRTETTRSFSGEAQVKTTKYGDASATASAQQRTRTESGKVTRRFENERTETGRQALGVLREADPFLEPGHDFVFLARFEGVQAPNATDARFDGVRPSAGFDQPVAVLTIVAYDAPSALLVE